MKLHPNLALLAALLVPANLAGCQAAPALSPASQPIARDICFPAAARVLNVRDFGAKGDGLTDDTAAIQAAMTEALRRSKVADEAEHQLRAALFYHSPYAVRVW